LAKEPPQSYGRNARPQMGAALQFVHVRCRT
jgi:hypothetical protein